MAGSFLILKPGTLVRLGGSRRAASVVELLGAGGQGAVYRVNLDDTSLALKWFHPHLLEDGELRRRIAQAVERGSPDPRFLWPLVLAGQPLRGPFGYLMELMPPAFIPVARLFVAEADRRITVRLRDRAAIGAELASAFLGLHSKGLAYQDINFGALMIDPDSMALLICDNDNVDIDGAPPTSLGTPKFMAPEIVRGEASPTMDTDLHSLAVVLFYLLFLCHPLEGKLAFSNGVVDAAAFARLFGTEPRFIFDEEDESNGPVPARHDAQLRLWQSMPRSLTRLFSRAFGPGLVMPRRRVFETEWLKELVALRDSIWTCAVCGFETPLGASGCAWCGKPHSNILSLELNHSRVLLEPGVKLYQSHLVPHQSTALPSIAGTVISASPEAVLLRNQSETSWHVARNDSVDTRSAPGEDIWLHPGDTVSFRPDCVGKVAK